MQVIFVTRIISQTIVLSLKHWTNKFSEKFSSCKALWKVWKQGRSENTINSPLWKDVGKDVGKERQKLRPWLYFFLLMFSHKGKYSHSIFLRVQYKPACCFRTVLSMVEQLSLEHLPFCSSSCTHFLWWQSGNKPWWFQPPWQY